MHFRAKNTDDGVKMAEMTNTIRTGTISNAVTQDNASSLSLVAPRENQHPSVIKGASEQPTFAVPKHSSIQLDEDTADLQRVGCAIGTDHESVVGACTDVGKTDAMNNDPTRFETVLTAMEEQSYSVFPRRTRNFVIFMAALCGFISPLSGNIYFPALDALSADLHVAQSSINISLTTYMIFQGLAPAFMGDLADNAGRRPAYVIGFSIYIGACIGLALQTSFPALLVLRCIQAAGSSSTIALASAVAADISTAAERGTYMGLVNGGALAGPAIGPLIGGILAQFLGWRAIFWFLVILGGAIMVPIIVAFPETGRNVVGNGSLPPQRWNRDLLSIFRDRRARRDMSELELENARLSSEALAKTRKFQFPNPLSTLKIIREKDVALLLLYNCLVYCSYYSVTSSLPYLFEKIYGFNELQIGLSFLPYGVGALLASLFNGRVLDWRFRKVAESMNVTIVKGKATDTRHFPLEKVRLPIALVLLLVGNSALLCYGWVSHSFEMSQGPNIKGTRFRLSCQEIL